MMRALRINHKEWDCSAHAIGPSHGRDSIQSFVAERARWESVPCPVCAKVASLQSRSTDPICPAGTSLNERLDAQLQWRQTKLSSPTFADDVCEARGIGHVRPRRRANVHARRMHKPVLLKKGRIECSIDRHRTN